MAAPWLAPLIIAGANILSGERQKQKSLEQIPAQILANRAKRFGINTAPYDTRMRVGMAEHDDWITNQEKPLMQLVSMMPLMGQSGPSETSKEELAEIQQQKLEGFRTRPMRSYEF